LIQQKSKQIQIICIKSWLNLKKHTNRLSSRFQEKPYTANKYYYGESILQQEVRYYPIVQLIIVSLFLTVTIIAQRTAYISTQNQLWAAWQKKQLTSWEHLFQV
jgi:hypothetical protein